MSNQDKRYQVFVSSTYLDLIEERQAVTAALLQLDAFPSGMELFPAADDDAWTLIKRVIDDCDYYLLIVAGKYGSVDPSDGLSYTQKEYEYAVSAKKPVMAFLHSNIDDIVAKKIEKDPDTRKKLEDFRSKVKQAKHVKFWTTADQLGGQVALSYAQFTKQYPAMGWVRADQITSSESLAELVSLRKRLAELETQLDLVSSAPPPGTSGLAQGDDPVQLEVHLRARPSEGPARFTTVSAWVKAAATWNQIISTVGPYLLNECEETDLRQAFEKWILENYWATGATVATWDKAILEAAYRQEVVTKGAKADFAGHKLNLEDDSFNTVIVQLVALGIIKHGDKKRSVTDRNTYWGLTRYGENQLIKLRALPRPSTGDLD